MKKQVMRRGYVFSAWLAIAAMVLFSSALVAQTTGAGTITGTVTDPNSGAVPGAAVVVHNTNTGATLSLVTNAAGLYVAPFMQPGSYEITANKAGFGKILRQNLTLQVGQTLTVDVPLPLASTTETVTVTGETSVVDTQKDGHVASSDRFNPATEPAAGRPALGKLRSDGGECHE